ncbi:MAG: DNA polymerase/3'-5' exonuclease PolX [Candidatus Omnitrophota bacterium]
MAIIFSRIADILEIKGENVFKIRAYRVAAQNISGFSSQLNDVYKESPALLEEIPGIGKDLKEKIIEMIETSKLKYHEELVKEFSSGFVDMLNLSGMGPKKLKKLRDELNIKNINDLEKACKEGKLAAIEGMAEKTQEKLLQAIKHYRESEGRMLISEAGYFSAKITEYLSQSKLFKKIETAGSFRRGAETIGDIDILATTDNAGAAMYYFVNYPEAREIIAKGLAKSSISVKEGPQIDLRIADDVSYGAALVYFTGSKQHNIKIRAFAKNKGYKVNEYGVFSTGASGKEKMIAGLREEDVYKSLGMEWIPPELREDQGEVEAAIAAKLPKNLLEAGHIQGDLHSHTNATDGHDSLEEMVRAAQAKGYKYIAITDHSKAVKIANGMDEEKLLMHAEKIRKFAKKIKGIEILAGVEVDILEKGKLDLEDYALKEMDIVIAAAHSHFGLDEEKQTARVLKAMDNKYVNILAHPSGRLITSRSSIQADFDKIFKHAAWRGICLEINTHGERIDLNAAHCRRAKELGAKFAINTDAHSASQLDLIVYGVVTARRGWVEKQDVINTYSFSKLVKMLRRSE